MLAHFTVYEGFEVERVRVADLIGRYDPGPDRAMSIKGFAQRHSRRTHLPVAHAHVVDDEIAGNHLVSAIARHVAAASTDHKTEFSLVVERLRSARQMNRIVRTNHAGGLLVKKHWEGGFFAPGLGHVVGVVQTDREELGRARNGRFQL